MRLAAKLALLVVTAVLAGGCGAAGKESERGGANTSDGLSAGEDSNIHEEEIGGNEVFRSGFMTCQLYPLTELARQNNVPAKAKKVAEAVASLETSEQDRKDVYEGCLKGIRSMEQRP